MTPPFIEAFKSRIYFAVSKLSTIIENSLDFAARSMHADILAS
jgi:hypothetical protein